MFQTLGLFANLSLEGHYQGKSLFIQNPEDEDGFGFCVTQVTVNGKPIVESVQKPAFEIGFDELDIKIGDLVFIVLEHGIGCKPKILNPEVLLPKSTFEIKEMSCSADGNFTWSTLNESGKLAFIIEQYRWNKWVVVGQVNGIGLNTLNNYSFKVSPHSGENQLRVVQIDHSGKKRVSEPIKFVNSSIQAPNFFPKRVKDVIKFSAEGVAMVTKFEIFDAYGNIVKKGLASEVDCSNLRKGAYYINYDNKSEKFIKG
ncbi:hypothetical protein DNU06_13760 [Putridiphycobacter roseus]|uniref:Secretion system C-terminal sorting domain-containing protein n=2 Tax=Putridiphycobacter roseus TaxID=2219161 RepID=A0A2W1MYC1_9FLAO|nr:hypothetical protein DNU06_13760 [Putridiphycobacter roseus]